MYTGRLGGIYLCTPVGGYTRVNRRFTLREAIPGYMGGLHSGKLYPGMGEVYTQESYTRVCDGREGHAGYTPTRVWRYEGHAGYTPTRVW